MTRDPTDRDVVASKYRFMHLIHQSVQETIVFCIVVDISLVYRTHRVTAYNIITVRSIINNPKCESNSMQFSSHYTCNNIGSDTFLTILPITAAAPTPCSDFEPSVYIISRDIFPYSLGACVS